MNKQALNILLWGLVVLPMFQLGYGFYQVQYAGDIFYYGPEPAKAVVHTLGLWAMAFLFLVLATRHLKKYTPLNLIPMRRRLGLSAFFYAVLHLLAYIALILGFQWHELASEIQKRPYILVGTLSILLMLPMAITSTKGWQRRLKQKWKTLHLLVYPVAILVLIHLWWQVRAGFLLASSMTLLITIAFILRFLPNRLAQAKTSSNL
ncbi:protein-methionine-sulfoxide reductase heme-binding subunit MsrQ [Oceaniserpentilla sp. 4NH20-0058]|uniref:sulfite oxidase heme-binding subunit YedZ n=1 Tax=Oceaniserpentilla sp. 4NH20-0058 TaxID=3127660 RepID=UPI0031056332